MNTSAPAPIRVAHLADLHIGSALRGLADYPGAPAIDGREAPYEALRAAVRRIVEGGYDAVLIAGDVFDRRHCDARALAACQDALGAFHEAGLRTVVVSGNHDAETPLPHKLNLPPSVRWLGADAPESVTWPDLGITVHGQSVAGPDERRDLAAASRARSPAPSTLGCCTPACTVPGAAGSAHRPTRGRWPAPATTTGRWATSTTGWSPEPAPSPPTRATRTPAVPRRPAAAASPSCWSTAPERRGSFRWTPPRCGTRRCTSRTGRPPKPT